MPKAKKDRSVEIICDHREPIILLDALAALPDVTIRVEQLEIGDFVIAPGVVCERKTPEDLAASIIDTRFHSQIANVKETGHRLIMLFEGDPYRCKRLHPNAIAGALSFIAAVEGISSVLVPNMMATAGMLKTLAQHTVHGLASEVAVREAAPKTLRARQEYLVNGLPGIGLSRSRKLLDHFGTPAAVFAASETEIAEIDGFGPALASSIRSLLTHCDRNSAS